MKKTILLVEDEEELRDLLASELREFSFNVIEAGNGREAASMLTVNEVDLVITDLRMHGGDGLELLSNVQATPGKNIRTILMSGYADCTPTQAKSFGADELLHKPFGLTQFVRVVTDLIGMPCTEEV